MFLSEALHGSMWITGLNGLQGAGYRVASATVPITVTAYFEQGGAAMVLAVAI